MKLPRPWWASQFQWFTGVIFAVIFAGVATWPTCSICCTTAMALSRDTEFRAGGEAAAALNVSPTPTPPSAAGLTGAASDTHVDHQTDLLPWPTAARWSGWRAARGPCLGQAEEQAELRWQPGVRTMPPPCFCDATMCDQFPGYRRSRPPVGWRSMTSGLGGNMMSRTLEDCGHTCGRHVPRTGCGAYSTGRCFGACLFFFPAFA